MSVGRQSILNDVVSAIVKTGEQQTRTFELNGNSISFRYRPSIEPSKWLIIGFRGAINRDEVTVPAFPGLPSDITRHAHALLLADPSISARAGIRVSWYAGHDGFNTQHHVRRLVDAFSAELGAVNRIYFGRAGGGFAALHASWHDPGSVAVVGNPETCFNYCHRSMVRQYLDACWPGVSELDELPDDVCTDLRTIYAQRFPNMVVYIQSGTDLFHTTRHMAPFLSCLGASSRMDAGDMAKKLIVDVGTWGSDGPQALSGELYRWTNAVMTCSALNCANIRAEYKKLIEGPNAKIAPTKPISNTKVSAEADIDMTRRLLAYHRRQANG